MRTFIALALALGLAGLGSAAESTTTSSSSGGGGGFQSSSSTYNSGEIPKTSKKGTSAGDLAKEAGKTSPGTNKERSLGAQAGHYFLSRWYDLVDVVDFSVGAGPGFMVHAQITKVAQAVGGYSDAYQVGFRGRSAGVWREKRKEVGISLLYYQKVERERITGWVESFRSDKMDLDTSSVYANNNDRSFLGIGATVQAGIYVHGNVRPMQALDFILGWMTIDILEDDHGKPRRNKDL